MDNNEMPSLSFWKERVFYNPETGVFVWVQTKSKKLKPGDRAGSFCHFADGKPCGYRKLSVLGHKVYEHRLAWFMMTGEWPSRFVDHIDGDKGNNQWTNLRLATPAQNAMNSRDNERNTSGFRGVTAKRQKWQAQIAFRGYLINLGIHKTREDASAAYAKAARDLYGEFAETSEWFTSLPPSVSNHPSRGLECHDPGVAAGLLAASA